MKMPATPPDWQQALASVSTEQLWILSDTVNKIKGYPHWDKVRRLHFNKEITPESVWAFLKIGRIQNRKVLPLEIQKGKFFSYTLPDELLQGLERITSDASGHLDSDSIVTSPETRDRFIVRSLMEEAITSSQLEGASTTRRVAKEMLRTNRPARTRSEQMILNNYRAMQWVRNHIEEEITPDLILELHSIVSRGTLDDPSQEGRLQQPSDERIVVGASDQDLILHEPPSAEELPTRLEQLCAFANGDDGKWMPKVLRAIICHFMVGYDHYFVDGNGRTARALFYWVALKEDAWLLEYIPISRILKNAPVKYASSYLHSETDDGDLTYFALYQVEVITRGLADLRIYLNMKAEEDRRILNALPESSLNYRQRAVVEALIKDANVTITAQSHAASHEVTLQTARADLRKLEELQFVTLGPKIRRQETWYAGERISEFRVKATRNLL